jgi:hypothetical protein
VLSSNSPVRVAGCKGPGWSTYSCAQSGKSMASSWNLTRTVLPSRCYRAAWTYRPRYRARCQARASLSGFLYGSVTSTTITAMRPFIASVSPASLHDIVPTAASNLNSIRGERHYQAVRSTGPSHCRLSADQWDASAGLGCRCPRHSTAARNLKLHHNVNLRRTYALSP